MSLLFRDRPHSAMDTAIYWTEYVIQHGGAYHLRSRAAQMPTYQYLLLDVVGAYLIGAVLLVAVIYGLLKTLFTFLFRKSGRKGHQNLKLNTKNWNWK